MKRIRLLVASLAAGLLMAGCGNDPHNTDDVKKYIKEELNIDKYDLTESGDSSWTVSLQDFEFRIVDRISQQLFGTDHYLVDDYENTAADYLTADFANNDAFYKEVTEDEDGIITTTFYCRYENRDQIEERVEDANALTDMLKNSKYPVAANFYFCYAHPLRETEQIGYFGDDADVRVFLVEEITDEKQKEIEEKAIILSKDFGYDEFLLAFSKQEIKDAILNSSSCVGICRKDPERDEYEYYDDICGSLYGGLVSYGTLYEVLEREQYAVEGDARSFCFTGIDDAKYEVSFQGTVDSIWMKKDGETFSTCQFGHLSKNEIKEMTGINAFVWKYDYQPNANVYAADGNLNMINTITLDGKELTYEEVREGYFGNITDDYKYLKYDSENKCYLITIDIGWHTDNQSYPMVIAEWVQALGGSYSHDASEKPDAGIYKAKWTIGKNKYSSSAKFKSGEISEFRIQKNGRDVTPEIASAKTATFMLMIRAEDFAELMGMKLEVDQKEGVANFTIK